MSSSTTRRTIAVIGAGPAGSLVAILLARRGHDVTLIEQHRFPRDKVCGECLSALGQDVLQRHGLAAILADAVPIRRSILHTAAGSITTPLPRPMHGITRQTMDTRLLDAANNASVRVMQPARCESLDLRVRDLETNVVRSVPADVIVVADGKGVLSQSAGPRTGDMGIKAHFTNIAADPAAVTLFATGDCYGGVAPVVDLCRVAAWLHEDDNAAGTGQADRDQTPACWNLAWSVPSALLKEHAGDLDAVLGALRRRSSRLDAALNDAQRTGDWQAAPLPRFAVGDWPGDVWCVGNAAAALEPIGGEGMGLALRSAEIVAEAIHVGRDRLAVQRDLQRLWRRRRLACRTAALAMTSRSTAHAAFWFAKFPPIRRAGLALLGKSA